jgi:hypothetical protein
MTGTPESFYRQIQRGDYTGGFLNRFGVAPIEKDLSTIENDGANAVNWEKGKKLIEKLGKLLPEIPASRFPKKEQGEEPKGRGEWEPDFFMIPWANDEAKGIYERLRDEMNAERESPDFNRKYLCQRVAENSTRVATNIAVGCNGIGARVGVTAMTIGDALMRLSFTTACAQSEKHNAIKFPMADFCEEIISFIWSEGTFDGKPKIAGEATRTQLSRRYRNNMFHKNSLQDALNHLKDERRLDSFMRTSAGTKKVEVWKGLAEVSGEEEVPGKSRL